MKTRYPTDGGIADPATIAVTETRRLEAIDRDLTDAEITRCECLALAAYGSPPTSIAGIEHLATAALEIEGELLDPAILILLESIRDAARTLAALQ